MGRVIVGAVLGMILGGIIGGNIKYNDAVIHLTFPAGQGGAISQMISLAIFLHYISLIAGVASGAIVGAIAGGVSAQPHLRPLGIWFWVLLAVLALLLLFGLAVYWIMPSGVVEHQPQQPPPQPMRQPQNAPGNVQRGEAIRTVSTCIKLLSQG